MGREALAALAAPRRRRWRVREARIPIGRGWETAGAKRAARPSARCGRANLRRWETPGAVAIASQSKRRIRMEQRLGRQPKLDLAAGANCRCRHPAHVPCRQSTITRPQQGPGP